MNYRHENSTAEGIALAHTVYGEPVVATAPTSAVGENVQRAVGNIMSPYKDPEIARIRDEEKRCAEEGCKAYHTKEHAYCAGHARLHGLLPTCKLCTAPPMRNNEGYCYNHGKPREALDEPG